MSSRTIESILYWIVRSGAYFLPFTLLIVSGTLFFPYITAKNFFFRGIVEVMSAAWIGLLFINFAKYWPRRTFIGIALATLVFVSFLSAIFGVDFGHSFWSNYERMEGVVTYIHLLLLFLILAGTFRAKREWFSLFGVSLVVSFMLAFYGMLEYLGKVDTFADSQRVISTLGNPLYVAAYLTFHIFLIAFLWSYIKSSWLRWMLALLFIFELMIFFLTGSRGAFLGIIVGAGIMFFLWIFTVPEKKKKVIFFAIFLLLIAVPLLFNFADDVSFIKNNNVLSRFSSISLSDSTVQSRFTIWKMAVRSFAERPILGWGVGNFIIPFAENYDPKMYGNEPWFDRTHSMPLEWLVSAGALGFLSYVILFGTVLWALLLARKDGIFRTQDTLIFIGMFVAYLFQLLFVFDTLATYLMLIMMLGFLAVISSSRKEEWETGHRPRISRMLNGGHIAGIVGVFVVMSILLFMINIRPYNAAKSLIDAFRAVGDGNNKAVVEHFQRSLNLTKGTVGSSEVREHLARTVSSGVQGNPEVLANPDIKELVELASSAMEDQYAHATASPHKNVRELLMVGRLYTVLGSAANDRAKVEQGLMAYEEALYVAPNYVALYPFIAETNLQIGNIERALEAARTAESLLVAVDNAHSDISSLIPFIYVAAGDYDNALLTIQRALVTLREHGGRSFDGSEISRMAGLARSRSGQNALPFIIRVYEITGRSNAVVALVITEMYAEIGDIETAKIYAIEAKAIDPSVAEEVDQFLSNF